MSEETPDARRQTPDQSILIIRRPAALLVSILVLSACDGRGAASTSAVTSTTAAETTTSAAAVDPWIWGIDEVELGDGFALGPCTGDADQFACLAKDGSVIGSAERLSLPAESFDFLDEVNDPVESMQVIADDYLATFSADRQSSCPNLEFRDLVPTEAVIATLPGLRYGFEELDDGRIVEKNVIYGVRAGETIDLFTFAAIADGGCLSNEGELGDPDVLEVLSARLDEAMTVVKFR